MAVVDEVVGNVTRNTRSMAPLGRFFRMAATTTLRRAHDKTDLSVQDRPVSPLIDAHRLIGDQLTEQSTIANVVPGIRPSRSVA